MIPRSKRSAIFFILPALLALPLRAATQDNWESLAADGFKALPYRHIGPVGNRVSAVVGEPGNANVYYIGAASGGIFKSVDAGVHWSPVFDDQPAASIGSLAVAPSDPNIVWAGTGETFIRSNVSIGNGIYRSTDAGATWTHMGLEDTGRIGRIVIHPTNPDIVWAAAMGHCYGPQQERGIYRTTDGGRTWRRILFVDENTGASDLVIDPNNPRILFAGMWQMTIWTWGRQSGGPGSGLYVSRDGGDSWEQLEGSGLPKSPWGKVGLTMSAADSNRVYALIETNSNQDFDELKQHQGVLWRSDDGGRNWKLINSDHTLAQRPHYYSRAAAAPDDADEIHFMSVQHSISLDGGLTFTRGTSGGDHHDIWIDPRLPDRIAVGHDGGVSISTTRGKSWMRPRLPIAQMYHVFVDDQIPYSVMGNRQDGNSQRGPSRSLSSGDIPIGAWHSVGGCESGFSIPDPADPNIVWSGCYEGILDRYDERTGHSRNVMVWPDNPESWPAGDLRYRFQWTFPIAISPHDHNRVYVGSQHVHVTTDGGQSWKVISPDLTSNDKSKQMKTGGLTPDDASPTYAAVLFAIAESPVTPGLIWAGSNDGRLHLTRDGGDGWDDVTANIPELPPWGTISNIEPSRFDAATAYISVDLHQVNDTAPYVYKTDDYGQTWKSLAASLPQSVFSYVHVIREDPRRAGLLYLGTENSLFVSFDDGTNWRPLQSNLPHSPVYWLTIQERFGDLVAATYGRGFWILDDISPLRQIDDAVLSSKVHFFAPRPAYRFRGQEGSQSQPEDPGAGDNPPYGASLTYYLGEEVAGEISLTIADSQGTIVRTLKSSDRDGLSRGKGLNRVYWDLREEPSKEPHLRTKPLEHSHVIVPDKGWRGAGDGRRVSLLAPPGTYTLTLKVDGTDLTQPLRVIRDPHSARSERDIAAQSTTLRAIRDDVDQVVAMINEIEWLRKQLVDLRAMIKGRDSVDEILDAAETLEGKLEELEGNFFDLRLTGGTARQDSLRWPRRLYSKLTSLFGYIAQSDFPPTDQQLEVFRLFQEQLAQHRKTMEDLRRGDIAAFNAVLGQAVLGGLITGIAD